MPLRLPARPLLYRRTLILLVHIALIPLAYLAAFGLRFDFQIPPQEFAHFQTTVWYLLGIRLIVFWAGGLPRLLEACRAARPRGPGARRHDQLGGVRGGAVPAGPVAGHAPLRVPARLGGDDLLLGRHPLRRTRAAREPPGARPPGRRAAHHHHRRRRGRRAAAAAGAARPARRDERGRLRGR